MQPVYANNDNNHHYRSMLLSTAIVQILSQSGEYIHARALLDCGSERSFITQSLCDILNPKIIQSTITVHGVGNSITQCTQSCLIELKSRVSNYTTRIQCLVLPKITSNLPITSLCVGNFLTSVTFRRLLLSQIRPFMTVNQ